MNNQRELLVDIGNTNMKIGFYDDYQIELLMIESSNLNWKKKYKVLKNYIDELNIQSVIFTTRFNNINDTLLFDKLVKKYSKNVKFKNSYIALIQDHKSFAKDIAKNEIGSDIYLPVSYINKTTTLKNYMVIDMGSAITNSLVLDNKLTSINIIPGYGASLDRMLSLLQLNLSDYIKFSEEEIEYKGIDKGKTTVNSVLSGSRDLFKDILINTIKQFIIDFDLEKVFLTGGDSDYFRDIANDKIEIDENLIFKSLVELNK